MDSVLQTLKIVVKVDKDSAVRDITSVDNALGKLQTTLDSISTSKFDSTMGKLSAKASETGKKIKEDLNLKGMKVTAPSVTLPKQAASGTKAVEQSLKGFKDTSGIEKQNAGWGRFTRTLWRTRGIITSIATVSATLAGVGRSTIGEASDYIEAVNLFNYAMGSYAEQAGAYAQKVQDFLGIDMSNWMQQQGTLNQMARGYGMNADEAYRLSQTMTNLAYDYASFFNRDFDVSFEKIRSAISGQVRPMRQFGVDLTQASLAQTALNHGIEKSVEDMSQAEKAYLRAIAIQDAASNFQGDMARTIMQPANAMRVLGQLAAQAGRAIGFIFLPFLQRIIPIAQAVVIILRNVAQAIASFFGTKIPKFQNPFKGVNAAAGGFKNNTGGAAKNMGDAGKAAGKTAKATKKASDNTKKTAKTVKKIKRELAGFDALNVLSFSKPSDTKNKKTKTPSTGGGGGGGAGGGGGGVGGGGGGPIDFWDQLTPYDLFAGAEKRVEELVEKIKILGKVALTVGGIFLGWKIAKSFLEVLTYGGTFASSLLSVLYKIGLTVGGFVSKFLPFNIVAESSLAMLTSMAAAISIIIFRLVSAVKNSKLFRTGVKAILTLVKMIVVAVGRFLIWVGELASSLKINKEVMDGIKDVIAVIAGLILTTIFPPAGALLLIAEGLIIAIKAVGALMQNPTFVNVLDKIKKVLGNIMRAVGKSLAKSIRSIVSSLRVIWKVLKPVFALAMKIVLIVMGAGLATIFGGIIAAIVLIAKALAVVVKIIAKIVKGISDFFKGIGKVYNVFAKLTGLPEIKFNAKEVKLKASLDKKSKKNLDKLNKTKDKTVTTSLKGKQTSSSRKTTKAYDHLKDKKSNVTLNGTKTKTFNSLEKTYPNIKNKNSTIHAFGSLEPSFKHAFGSDGKGGSYSKPPKSKEVTQKVKAWVPKLKLSKKQAAINGINTWYWNFSGSRGITYYAKGGFPDIGSLFVAGEAGPEMVGTINNKPAVANNEQIVSAVANGVTNAMISALRQVSSSGGSSNGEMTINVPVYLDNEVVAKGTVKYINGQIQRYGVSPITG